SSRLLTDLIDFYFVSLHDALPISGDNGLLCHWAVLSWPGLSPLSPELPPSKSASSLSPHARAATQSQSGRRPLGEGPSPWYDDYVSEDIADTRQRAN